MVPEDRRKKKRDVPPAYQTDRLRQDPEYPDEWFDFLEDGEVPWPDRTRQERDEPPDSAPADDLYWREPEQIWADDMWPWPEESRGSGGVRTDPS